MSNTVHPSGDSDPAYPPSAFTYNEPQKLAPVFPAQPQPVSQSGFGTQFHPYPGQHIHTCVVTAQPIAEVESFGRLSQEVHCPDCNRQVTTKRSFEVGSHVHGVALFMCLLGCGLCAFVPYVINEFKDVKHTCPDCGCHLGTYKKHFIF